MTAPCRAGPREQQLAAERVTPPITTAATGKEHSMKLVARLANHLLDALATMAFVVGMR